MYNLSIKKGFKFEESSNENKHKMEDRNIKNESENNEIRAYLISLSEAAKISGYTIEHLNLLCRKKLLKSMKVGRNWHTTKEWLNEFLFLPKVSDEGKKYKRRKKDKNIQVVKKYITEAKDVLTEEKETLSGRADEQISYNVSEESISPEVLKQAVEVEEKKAAKNFGWPKAVALSFSTLSAFIFLFLGISFWQYWEDQNYLKKLGIPTDLLEDSFLFSDKPGQVQGEETITEDLTAYKGAVAASENFKMEEISFSGTNITLASQDNVPVEIYDIRSEVFGTRDGKQAQILISWKTSKLAISEINYSRDGVNSKNLQEKFYGFNHNIVLTKLDLDATYAYEIKVRDRWGNEIGSGKFKAYTGAKIFSIFDLIVEALNDTFSWAVKK